MNNKTLAERMEPVLCRPGMYLGELPLKLLWYLSGMIDLHAIFSGNMHRNYQSLHSLIAEKLGMPEVKQAFDRHSEVETKLLETGKKESEKLICDTARELLAKIEN
jgi:hypothetical protein